MRMETADPSLVDQMTRLKLKLLEKKLENERENLDDQSDTAASTARSFDGQGDALHNALKRRKGLLQKLRLPQQPSTIIQQLPQQQPLITQIPPPQALPPIRSGSIKEDMVELMLMQNAQMHQIIMHNMMLKALPPMAFSQPGSSIGPVVSHGQDVQSAVPLIVKAEKPRPSSVHHHHHYSAQGQPTSHPLPPIGHPLWPSLLPSNPMAQHSNLQPSVQHLMGPTMTLPALQTSQWNILPNASRTVGADYYIPEVFIFSLRTQWMKDA
ncbi:uncharacterized protein C21orf58 homolog isoform X5 [Scyliorhinus torazame]|uniref:uncharacterized protein C21orf58 homolog isoform X5 n=1 Tax=Scyliorhinus torazame TaxID=75743 RepID=UPI003B5ABB4A